MLEGGLFVLISHTFDSIVDFILGQPVDRNHIYDLNQLMLIMLNMQSLNDKNNQLNWFYV